MSQLDDQERSIPIGEGLVAYIGELINSSDLAEIRSVFVAHPGSPDRRVRSRAGHFGRGYAKQR